MVAIPVTWISFVSYHLNQGMTNYRTGPHRMTRNALAYQSSAQSRKAWLSYWWFTVRFYRAACNAGAVF